jgi:diguanylate cyclase (GGDEF)-like protein
VGGRAIRDNALIVVADYQTYADPLPCYVEDGIRAAMAAPVRRGDQAVGSLTVATRRADRVYSTSEQEVLTAFAEHVSLALNDAQAVDALRRAVAEATHQSLHDSLTGLPNRSMFLGRLTAAAERSTHNDGAPYALLFVDLDDFKIVNDSLGHLVGDQLLTAVAGRVSACLRPVDTVARLGGDEFAVLLEDSTIPAAQATAERLLDALRTPFDLPDATSVRISASVGVVTTAGRQGSAEELLRDADVAMYRAKGDGKHRYVVFEQAMRDRLQARNLLECELHQAVASAEFVVHYQPVVDAASGAVVSTAAPCCTRPAGRPRSGAPNPACVS